MDDRSHSRRLLALLPCSKPSFLRSVLLVRNLNSDDQAVVLKALRLAPEGRLRRDGLRALSSLLVHGNNKVMAAVSTQLRSLSLGPAFRERALLCFLDQLEDDDVQTRVAGCLALGCIKVTPANPPTLSVPQPWALGYSHLLRWAHLNASSPR